MAGKFDRFMVDVHIGTNRKLRRLTVPERWCHVAGVLALAAQAPIRGRLLVGQDDATLEDFAELAGVSTAVARSTVEKLRDVAVIVPDVENGCEMIHDWEEMNPQPKRDATAAERMRRYRERRNERNPNRNVTDRNAVTVTPGREEKGIESANALSSSAPDGADPKEQREIDKANDDDQRLCRLLAELAKQRNPKFKVKSKAEWLRSMRLCREKDGNTPEEIERLIRWIFTDPSSEANFWAGTIQSAANLRDHFSQIWGKMTVTPLKAAPESSSAAVASFGGA